MSTAYRIRLVAAGLLLCITGTVRADHLEGGLYQRSDGTLVLVRPHPGQHRKEDAHALTFANAKMEE